jgi:hypothetical protein
MPHCTPLVPEAGTLRAEMPALSQAEAWGC